MHKVSLRLTDEQYDFINEFRQVPKPYAISFTAIKVLW